METVRNVEELGEEIESLWRATDYSEGSFPEIAHSALVKRALPEVLSTETVFRWMCAPAQIPGQVPDANFGEPAVRLYVGRRFHIDALFWMDGTTDIHQHGFSGAFQVIAGSSIHTPYTFERQEVITSGLMLGRLTAAPSELLRVGEVRLIRSEPQFIHSLFHLNRPSISLVVRTDRDVGKDPQFTYLHPGIAYDPFVPDERLPKLLRLLDVLPIGVSASALLCEAIERLDSHAMTLLLVHWFRARPVGIEEREELLSRVARRHQGLAAQLRVSCEESRRQSLVIDRRRRIHRCEHRFLLALVLNVGSRGKILELVAKEYPGIDPVLRIVTWVREIVAIQEGEDRENPLGYALGEAELKVFEQLMHCRTPDEIIVAMAAEYEDVREQEPEIRGLCEALKRAALFQPLFRLQA